MNRSFRKDRAFSLVEVAICIVIVGIMFAGAMTSLGAAKTSAVKISDRSRGRMLAQGLMTEILSKNYHDPLTWGTGRGPSETTRSTFDDVDDYNGWTESPPLDVDGTPIPGFDGHWSRSVRVQWSQTDGGTTLDTPSGSETGLKAITVTVKRGDVVEAQLVAVRSSARPAVESREVLSP